MKFFQFLEATYVTKNLELQKEFDLKTRAETQVAQKLINLQEKYFRTIAYFTLITTFVKCKLTGKVIERPKPTLLPKEAPNGVETGPT